MTLKEMELCSRCWSCGKRLPKRLIRVKVVCDNCPSEMEWEQLSSAQKAFCYGITEASYLEGL